MQRTPIRLKAYIAVDLSDDAARSDDVVLMCNIMTIATGKPTPV